MRAALVFSFCAFAIPALAADADPFDPSGALAHGTGTLQGEFPRLTGEGPAFGLHGAVADDLAVQRFADGTEAPLLSEALSANAYGAYTYKDLFRVDVFVPVYLYAEAPGAFQGAAIGDLRLQGLIPVVAPSDAFALAFRPSVGVPTGTSRAMVRRGFAGSLAAVMGGEVSGAGWTSHVGITGSPVDTVGDVGLGSTIDLLGGGWYRISESFRLGAEVDAAVGLARGDGDRANHRATGHLFAQTVSPLGLGMTIGAGTGLLAGVGAPDYRMFAAVTWGPTGGFVAKVKDTDEDGIGDDVDACVTEPEDIDQFEDTDGCPDTDNDEDGIPDLADGCPLEAEDLDDFVDEDGCPDPDNDADTVLDVDDACPNDYGSAAMSGCPDRDEDGLADREDQCPEEAGPLELKGCPDRDSDQVPDFRDKCPDVPKHPDEDPEISDGCPKRVYVTAGEIKITEQILFDSGKSTIKKDSHALLDEIAQVFLDQARILKVEVQGHTDDQGSESGNLKLSQNRAQAVVDYLKAKGVEEGRMVSKGYGEANPIDSNRTEKGRANNRRVAFVILEQERVLVPVRGATPEAEPPPPVITP